MATALAPAARSAATARPCPSIWWWPAASPPESSERPGACRPSAYPRTVTTNGSFSVMNMGTRSASRSPTPLPSSAPASAVLKRLRQVPVKQRGHRGDAALGQRVGEPVVEVEAARAGRAAAIRLDPRPRDREPVGGDAEPGHQLDVLAPAVVVVGGVLAGLPVADRPGPAAERVPDRLSASVLAGRSLDLIGRGGDSPVKAGGKTRHRGVGHAAIVRALAAGRPFRHGVCHLRLPRG